MNVKTLFANITDLAGSVVNAAQPLSVAVENSATAVAECSVHALLAVAATEEERKQAQDIVAAYKRQ